ncbi:MAG: hypothetical protein QNJ63_30105 [Calothrix sp. MO_192.B10]|nr:hypothetical protein [Calothrix sp. MO_192.B10]
MKLNSTILLTLTLLTLMLGAGSVSAFWGFTLGSAALEGVSTPDSRPTNKFANSKVNSSQQVGVMMLKEEEILKMVKARIEGKTKTAKKRKSRKNKQQEQKKKTSFTKQEEKLQAGFPIKAESEGVSLSVQSSRFSGGALELQVKMQNQGSDTARFLYTFLDVTDDKGRTLSASTEGLPAELPPEGPIYTGRVIVPTPLLDGVKKISLTLTDYPAQKLRLAIPNIPVER